MASVRAQSEGEQEAELVNDKAKNYEVDNENFGLLATAKLLVESGVVEEIGGFWGGLITWVYDAWNSVTDWVSDTITDIKIAFGKEVPTEGAVHTGVLGSEAFQGIQKRATPGTSTFSVSGSGSLGGLGGLNLKQANSDMDDMDKKD